MVDEEKKAAMEHPKVRAAKLALVKGRIEKGDLALKARGAKVVT